MQLSVGWSVATADHRAFTGDAYTTPYELGAFDPEAEGFEKTVVTKSAGVRSIRPMKEANAAEGRRLAEAYACIACHATDNTSGVKPGQVGERSTVASTGYSSRVGPPPWNRMRAIFWNRFCNQLTNFLRVSEKVNMRCPATPAFSPTETSSLSSSISRLCSKAFAGRRYRPTQADIVRSMIGHDLVEVKHQTCHQGPSGEFRRREGFVRF